MAIIFHEDTCPLSSWQPSEIVHTHLPTLNILANCGLTKELPAWNLMSDALHSNTHAHTQLPTLLQLVSYHFMMWREVKGVLFPQQFVVLVVRILPNVISSIVIIVFYLCNNTGKKNKTKKQLEAN